MEPTANFLVMINSKKEDLIINTANCISDGFFMTGKPFLPFHNFSDVLVLPVGVNRALTKENPFVFDIKVKSLPTAKVNLIMGVMHEKGPTSRKSIPLFEKN